MKKLSLGKLKLASEEVLQRSQLASIYGGSDGFGTCGAGWNEGGVWKTTCGWNMQTAQNIAAQKGGLWCCDSCSYC